MGGRALRRRQATVSARASICLCTDEQQSYYLAFAGAAFPGVPPAGNCPKFHHKGTRPEKIYGEQGAIIPETP
jgi:hypothetical protein